MGGGHRVVRFGPWCGFGDVGAARVGLSYTVDGGGYASVLGG